MGAIVTRLELFNSMRALVIGDIMLDRFIYGTVDRISPESPAPLLTIKETRSMLGGVGNVVRNLSALGAETTLFTVVGDDATGKEITQLVGKETRVIGNIITEITRPSTLKLRYVADGQQMLRCDHETKRPIAQETNRRLLAQISGEYESNDVVIISDYKKGVLSAELMRLIINFAREHSKPVIIDPKPRHCAEYRGATVLTPNLIELKAIAQLSGCPVSDFDTDDDIVEASLWLAKEFMIDHMLVTRGDAGMTLASREGGFGHIPAKAHQVFDVSGAGDTVVATFALALASGHTPEESAHIANTAAGIAVERIGTSVVSQLDLQLARISERRIGGMHKIVDVSIARDIVARWKREGRKVGFTNGCFDMLHTGHLNLITGARSRCDRLILAINADSSVKRIKGKERPIQGQYERAMMLAGMEAVDLVVIYESDTPLYTITDLQPDALFKGSDYTAETVVGSSIVKNNGGEVIILPRTPDFSTSERLQKMRSVPPALVVINH